MSLIDRLCGFRDPNDPEALHKISVEAFWGHLYEMSEGRVTRAQMISRFGLDAAETTELDWIIGKYNAQATAAAKAKFVEMIRVFLVLAEGGWPGYSTNADLVAKINAL